MHGGWWSVSESPKHEVSLCQQYTDTSLRPFPFFLHHHYHRFRRNITAPAYIASEAIRSNCACLRPVLDLEIAPLSLSLSRKKGKGRKLVSVYC